MAIDAQKVKELREKTGLPMMECKRALEAANGDVEKAIENLRKAGMKAQAKLAGRTANQGLIGSRIGDDGRVGVLVALRCETEPVSKNEKFREVLEQIVDVVASDDPADRDALLEAKTASGATVEASITELINHIRENISLGRFARFEADAVVQYVHFDGKKAGMVAVNGGSRTDEAVVEMGNNIGQHIVFHRPESLSRDRLDPAIVENEKAIHLAAAKNDARNAKKPPEILEKIVSGQVEKFIASQCLVEQPYVKDDKQTVAQYVKSVSPKLVLADFAYVATDMD